MPRIKDSPAQRRKTFIQPVLKDREANAPRPLPEAWMTTPLVERLRQDGTPEIAAQADSPLFRLPVEVRQMIFEYVFEAGGALHVMRMSRRLAHLRFLESRWVNPSGLRPFYLSPPLQVRPDIWRPHYKQSSPGIWDSSLGSYEPEIPESQWNLLALPKTCRLASLEALPVLYATTEFDFTSVLNVLYFLDTVPQAYFHWITRLSLYCYLDEDVSEKNRYDSEFKYANQETWERMWNTIASLPQLRSLSVIINGAPTRVWPKREHEEKLLAPLRKVTVPDIYWLRLDYRLSFERAQNPQYVSYPENALPEIEEGPFKLLDMNSVVGRDYEY